MFEIFLKFCSKLFSPKHLNVNVAVWIVCVIVKNGYNNSINLMEHVLQQVEQTIKWLNIEQGLATTTIY